MKAQKDDLWENRSSHVPFPPTPYRVGEDEAELEVGRTQARNSRDVLRSLTYRL